MKKLVILKFDGSFETGFQANLEIANDGLRPYRTVAAKLPENITIPQLLNSWHDIYCSRYGQYRIKSVGNRRVNIESLNQECTQESINLLGLFNEWLSTSSFSPIVNSLQELYLRDEIRIIISTSCHELRQLPWHLWDVLASFSLVEVALSSPNAEQRERAYREKIRILIILGDSSNINVDADKRYLQSFCGENAELILLNQPSREELNRCLQDEIGWDMLFFSGHSETKEMEGRIYINKDDSLTMAELRDALQVAIQKRLQIAFFNSCDGLGIAYELEQLYIPQVIVMRKPVPDIVAQEFLKYFLQEFTGGKSLYISVRNARVELQKLESEFPCASWLPVIVQNQTETPPTWQSMGIISFCPYQGLSAFKEDNAEYFFGRESATAGLVAAVNNKPLVALIGASGSGKSSLVFAGLIPQLRGDNIHTWQILSFRPGKNPFQSLAVALISALNLPEDKRRLAELELDVNLQHTRTTLENFITYLTPLSSPSPRILLIADQFEEIYTLCTDVEERRIFLDNLLYAVEKAPFFRLLITIRADFLSRALDDYEPFGRALHSYQLEPVVRMNREELEAAIILPAKRLGFEFEEGLSNTIINDIQDGDGRLPLLEFTLSQLWKQQYAGNLTHQAYKNIGGVEKALANYAEMVYAKLGEAERETAQRVFIQLVQPGEGTEDTRRLATREEVGEENWDLVTRLASERLVVTNRNELSNEETVEVVHEALIRHWGRLRGWMQENRKFRIWQQGLIVALQQWVDSNKDDGALLRGAPLAIAEDWLQKRGEEVSKPQRWFIEKSLELRERERKQKERLRRRVIGGLAAGLVLALSLAGFAAWQWREVQIRETNAHLIAGSLSAKKLLESKSNDLEALVEAVKTGKSLRYSLGVQPDIRMQALAILQQVIYGVKERNRFSVSKGILNRNIKFSISHNGNNIASYANDGVVKVWSKDGQKIQTIECDSVTSFSISPNGNIIAIACYEKGIYTPEEISHNIVYSLGTTILLWDKNGKFLRKIKTDSGQVMSMSFSFDGKKIASINNDGTIKIWSEEGRNLNTIKIPVISSAIVSPDMKTVALIANSYSIDSQNMLVTKELNLLDKDGKSIKKIPDYLENNNIIINNASFTNDSKIFAYTTVDQKIKLWRQNNEQTQIINLGKSNILNKNLTPKRQRISVKTNKNSTLTGIGTMRYDNDVSSLTFSSDDRQIAIGTVGGNIKIWNKGGKEIFTHSGYKSSIQRMAFSSQDKMIVSAYEDGIIKIWDIINRQMPTLKNNHGMVKKIIFNKDGKLLFATEESNLGSDIVSVENIKKIFKIWDQNSKSLADITSNILDTYNFSPDGRTIISISTDYDSIKEKLINNDDNSVVMRIKQWDISGYLLRDFKIDTHTDISRVASICVDHKGQLIVSGEDNGRIILWNGDGKKLRTIDAHTHGISSVSFNSDGKTFASGSTDGTIKLWSLDGKLLQIFRGHSDDINSISFNSDGKTFASGSADGTIKLWSLDGKEFETLKGYHKSVTSLSFSPDGKTLASSGEDGKIILWNFDLNDLLQKGCDHLHDYLNNNLDISAEDKHLCDDVLM